MIVGWLWGSLIALLLLPSYAPFTFAFLMVAAVYFIGQRMGLFDDSGRLLTVSAPFITLVVLSLIRLQHVQGVVLALSLATGLAATCVGVLSAARTEREVVVTCSIAIATVLTLVGALHAIAPTLPVVAAFSSRLTAGFAAIVGTYMLASRLEHWERTRVGVGAALCLVVALTGARTATVVLFVALLVVSARFVGRHLESAVLVVGALGMLTLSAAVVLQGAFVSRFTGGDNYSLGPLQINTEGRGHMWPLIWSDARESLWLGHGAGRASMVTELVWGLEHPHNELLRVLEDFGLVGLGALALVLVWIMRQLLRRGPVARGSLAVTLACVPLALTDNPMTYSVWLVPAGLLVGHGLALKDKPNIQAPDLTRAVALGRVGSSR